MIYKYLCKYSLSLEAYFNPSEPRGLTHLNFFRFQKKSSLICQFEILILARITKGPFCSKKIGEMKLKMCIFCLTWLFWSHFLMKTFSGGEPFSLKLGKIGSHLFWWELIFQRIKKIEEDQFTPLQRRGTGREWRQKILWKEEEEVTDSADPSMTIVEEEEAADNGLFAATTTNSSVTKVLEVEGEVKMIGLGTWLSRQRSNNEQLNFHDHLVFLQWLLFLLPTPRLSFSDEC